MMLRPIYYPASDPCRNRLLYPADCHIRRCWISRFFIDVLGIDAISSAFSMAKSVQRTIENHSYRHDELPAQVVL